DIVVSTDGGKTFKVAGQVMGTNNNNVLDQPSLATGPDTGGTGAAIWIVAADVGGGQSPIIVAGAHVTGPWAVGAFSKFTINGSNPGNFGDITVGPQGQVITYWETNNRNGGGPISVSTDPDGLGPAPFGAPVVVTNVNSNLFGANVLPSMP